MADVLRLALDRRNKLHDEIKRLDEFIRMAEALVRAEGDPQSVAPPKPYSATTHLPIETPEPAPVAPIAKETEESPMRAAARKLSDADVRRAPDAETGASHDAPRPNFVRRGLAG